MYKLLLPLLLCILSNYAISQKYNTVEKRGVLLKVGDEYFFAERPTHTGDDNTMLLIDSTIMYQSLQLVIGSGIEKLQGYFNAFCNNYYKCGDLGEDNKIKYKYVTIVVLVNVYEKKRAAVSEICMYDKSQPSPAPLFRRVDFTRLLVKKVMPL